MPKKQIVSPLSERVARLYFQRIDEFTVFLDRQGYTAGTVGTYRRHCRRFAEFAIKRGIPLSELDEPAARGLIQTVLGLHKGSKATYGVHCINRFVDFLIERGDAPSRPEKIDTSERAVLMRDYETYLREQRGLSEATIYGCVLYAHGFLTFKYGTRLGDLRGLKAQDITDYVLSRRKSARIAKDKSISTHLRSFFRFLYWAKRTDKNLAEQVPSRRTAGNGRIPRYLPPDDINRLIGAARLSPRTGRRDHAMILMMARLGLRAPEIIAIRLEDIDWRLGEVLIRGKGQLHDRMPLPQDVGQAVVDYIQNERPGPSRHLFVSTRAPFRNFADAQIVNWILNKAYGATDISPPQSYIGSHILRHSLATDLLKNGASLKEIGDVLRHRSVATTSIYAKYDVDALQALAPSWPVREDAQ